MKIINLVSDKSVSYKEVNIKIGNVLRRDIKSNYYIDGIIKTASILSDKKYNTIDEELYYSNSRLIIKDKEFKFLLDWFFTTYKIIK
jgi:hypothetical protein